MKYLSGLSGRSFYGAVYWRWESICNIAHQSVSELFNMQKRQLEGKNKSDIVTRYWYTLKEKWEWGGCFSTTSTALVLKLWWEINIEWEVAQALPSFISFVSPLDKVSASLTDSFTSFYYIPERPEPERLLTLRQILTGLFAVDLSSLYHHRPTTFSTAFGPCRSEICFFPNTHHDVEGSPLKIAFAGSVNTLGPCNESSP